MLKRVCCLRLNTTGVIIGWIGATFSLISIFMLILALTHLPDLTELVFNHLNEPFSIEKNLYSGLFVVASMYLTLNLVNLIASAMLIVGTIRQRHLWLLPWLINAGISLVLSALYGCYLVSSALTDPNTFSQVSFTSATISVITQFIVWYIILSLYKELQQERQELRQLAMQQTQYNSSNVSFFPYKYRDSRTLREEYANRRVK